MRTISQLLLTLLLNACWQIALIAGAVALCDWLLRGTAIRYRHLLWVCALTLSLGLPLLSTLDTFSNSFGQFQPVGLSQPQAIQRLILPAGLPEVDSLPPLLPDTRAPFRIDRNLALALLAFYVLFLLYRGFKLKKQNIESKQDRKSTRLNSSHLVISYAVFCLKKKKI